MLSVLRDIQSQLSQDFTAAVAKVPYVEEDGLEGNVVCQVQNEI